MPNMNGYEVLEFLKKDKRYYEIPIIMLSSMDDLTSIYRCIELGADDYVTKPFDKMILRLEFQHVLKKTTKGQRKAIIKRNQKRKRKI